MLPRIDMGLTGSNIARLRRNSGLTVRDVQDVLGFSTPQAIFKWQRGDCLPTVDNLVILAKLFHVTVNDILIVVDDDR
ncbi:MAG: helix-turn-helix transcriptional regulator [Erysipelotrichaceae bacterium]|nr:helix-turn-helix transcriptional regulator [Erysipelotrichaceae bacterium]